MLIKITEVGEVETKREGKRRWKEIRLDYETDSKSENYKILLDWANPDAFAEAQDCEEGKFYEVKVQKDGKYFNWTGIIESDATEFDDAPKSKGYAASKPGGGTDWAAKNKLDADRFAFEKDKQDLIIRQSCLAQAVASLGTGLPPDRYIQFAIQFEDFIWSGDNVKQAAHVPEKNIPGPAEHDQEAVSRAIDQVKESRARKNLPN